MDTKAKTELVAMTQALTERLLHRDAGDSRPTIEFTKAQFDELSSRCEAVIVCGGKPHRRFAGHIDDLIWEARARKDRRLKLSPEEAAWAAAEMDDAALVSKRLFNNGGTRKELTQSRSYRKAAMMLQAVGPE